MKRHLLSLACTLLPIVSFGAAAFTFSDGSSAVCTARGREVVEIDAPLGHAIYQLNYTGIAVPAASGYQIIWNVNKLASLPPTVHDLLFFHECAHARLETRDEVQANCAGLKDMRAAGRAGFAVEAKLAAFYGPGSDYWAATLKCANADNSAPAPGR